MNADSIYEETLNGRKFSLFTDDHLLPGMIQKLNFEFFNFCKKYFLIIIAEYVVELEYIPKPRSFPPLIFHDCLDNQLGWKS